MNKKIHYFGKDIDKPEFYNLIIVISEIPSGQVSDIKDEVLQRGFKIYLIDENRIEACFKDRYQEVLDKFRDLDKAGWRANVD